MTFGFPAIDLEQENLIGWRQLTGAMTCSRCGGFMVNEQCFDFLDDTGHLDFIARRCVQCGEVIDPVILLNRQRRLPFGHSSGHSSSGVSRSKEGS